MSHKQPAHVPVGQMHEQPHDGLVESLKAKIASLTSEQRSHMNQLRQLTEENSSLQASLRKQAEENASLKWYV